MAIQSYLPGAHFDRGNDTCIHKNVLNELSRIKKNLPKGSDKLINPITTAQDLTIRQREIISKIAIQKLVARRIDEIENYPGGFEFTKLYTKTVSVLDWFKQSHEWLLQKTYECMEAYSSSLIEETESIREDWVLVNE